MDNQHIISTVGGQLKSARGERGWSLDATSKNTGVSKAMLGQIERGESSPTITKLWQIATGFNLPLSYFLGVISNNTPAQRPQNLDTHINIPVGDHQSPITVTTLFPFDSRTNCEIFSLTLAPHHQHISLAHQQGVIEHIVVIEGAMEYYLNDQWLPLAVGDVAKFDASVKHGYRNVSDQQAIFHNIIIYAADKVG